MGSQTMESQAGRGRGSGGEGTQEQKSLARQGSLYSLTLDEVQHQLGDLGKPLSSMNLDELLKTVWTAEANQGMSGSDYAGTQPQQQQQPQPQQQPQQQHGQDASASSLHRQSSVTLARDLSKKTVDEVWQDIQQGQQKDTFDRKAQERQPTLGEMTLEDFLVKAGIVSESSPGKKNTGPALVVDPTAMPPQSIPQQAQWLPYQLPAIHHQQQNQQPLNMLPIFMPGHAVQQPITLGANPIMDVTYPDTQISMSPTPLMGTLSDTQTPGRKRNALGVVVEKTVERRQKRMIKNRESAARSRARKQAYTNELENKVSRLEEENERLRRKKEVEKLLPCLPLPEPKYQLRRTSSASF